MIWDPPSITRVAHVEARLTDRRWDWADREKDRIAAHWATLVAAKPALFNGRVLMRCAQAVDGETFRAGYLETDYANFLAARDLGWPETGVGNCYAMAALRGTDGAFLLGEMSPHTATAGQIYFAAGTPDRDDVRPGGVVDLAGSVLREMEEETGLTENDVTVVPGWTVVRRMWRTALMREIHLPMPAAEAKRRIEAFLDADPQSELTRMHLVRGLADLDRGRMPAEITDYLGDVFGRADAAQPAG